MKFRLYPASLIIIFLIVNICLFSGIIFLLFKTQDVKVVDINKNSQNYAISSLPRPIIDQINLGSRAFIIYDTKNRTIIAGKNEKLRFAPASSAKIMAAVIVLENYDLNSVLTAENLETLGSDNSKMKLVDGEQMTVENLLYGMMLPSGNDAALVISQNFLPAGRKVSGGVDGFVAAMNKKAAELSLKNTHFVDYDGYDDANFTTAYDLARLGSYAMKNPTFAKIVGTKSKYVYDVSGNLGHNLQNLNILLGSNGVNGIKTGYTDEAGGVLVSSIKNGESNYVIVVLGSQDRFSDTQNVIDNAVSKIKTLFY